MRRAPAVVMLLKPFGDTGGFADIEAAVGTTKDVDPVGCGHRHLESTPNFRYDSAHSGPAMSEAPKEPSRMVEAAGFAPASENTYPQEYYDAYPLLICRP